jgi:hypothetical protein
MSTTHSRFQISLQIFIALAVIAALFALPAQAALAGTIPTFEITAVDKDNTVTIKTANFPASRTFTARIGENGTLGIGGTVVGTTDSGTGGVLTATYSIPAALKGKAILSIRLESPGGYYAYNWFVNGSSTTPAPAPGYTGIPTFEITSVDKGVSVTVKTNNFPADKDFTVRIGKMGTLGLGGTVVATSNSGAGGILTATFDIPVALKDEASLAIRMDAPGGFYAYNWFVNNTAAVTPAPVPGYSGHPTFVISAVVKNTSVTITAANLPAGKDFTVRMGAYGTLGIGGTVVATTNSGAGGSLTATYTIPAALLGSSRIAIRMDATTGGFYAYNWFWNE